MTMIQVVLLVLSMSAILTVRCDGTFSEEFAILWGGVNIVPNDTDNGVAISLTSDGMGATFATNATYLFGSFSAEIKFVPFDSAGTVSAFFLISDTDNHDEIDFEFLGNSSGQPYLVHSNFFVNGTGQREQDIYLWYDPTEEFHTYQVIWNHELILWLVDGIPIRVHQNINNISADSFPTFRPMVVSGCIFDGSGWATEGGRVGINYTDAPFIVKYQNFTFQACTAAGDSVGDCAANYSANWWEGPAYSTFNVNWANQLAWVREHYLQYDYCTDTSRYPTPPIECGYDSALLKMAT